MTKKEFNKKYYKLWTEALKLPKQKVIKKLKEMSELKREYYRSLIKY